MPEDTRTMRRRRWAVAFAALGVCALQVVFLFAHDVLKHNGVPMSPEVLDAIKTFGGYAGATVSAVLGTTALAAVRKP